MLNIVFEIISKIQKIIIDVGAGDPGAIAHVVIYIFLLYFSLFLLKIIWISILNKSLSITSKPFSRTKPEGTSSERILVVGDSTAVGTGATRSEDSIAGRLGHDFPNAEIVNLGVDGSCIKDIVEQLCKVVDQKFDVVIISSGGNDVWRFTRSESLTANLRDALSIAKKISSHRVIFLLHSYIGSAPLFLAPLRLLLSSRDRKIRALIIQTTSSEKVPCIELFTRTEDNPFLKRPKELYAADGIHPSSEGYRVWYNRMWLEMVKKGYDFKKNGLP